ESVRADEALEQRLAACRAGAAAHDDGRIVRRAGIALYRDPSAIEENRFARLETALDLDDRGFAERNVGRQHAAYGSAAARELADEVAEEFLGRGRDRQRAGLDRASAADQEAAGAREIEVTADVAAVENTLHEAADFAARAALDDVDESVGA